MAAKVLASETIGAQASFFGEALYQGKCAVTGRPGPWDPHHVVYQQHLRRLGQPRYDRRNALRLSKQAHLDHTNAVRKVRTVELLDCNVMYAIEIMGGWRAGEYLRRYYDDVTQPDPRLEAVCPAVT